MVKYTVYGRHFAGKIMVMMNTKGLALQSSPTSHKVWQGVCTELLLETNSCGPRTNGLAVRALCVGALKETRKKERNKKETRNKETNSMRSIPPSQT